MDLPFSVDYLEESIKICSIILVIMEEFCL
jgi:hypothetical protein